MINPISFRADAASTKTKQKETTINVNSVGGTIGAAVAGGAVHKVLPECFGPTILNAIKKHGTLSGEDGKTVHIAVKQMLKDAQLDKKGVKIKFLESLPQRVGTRIYNEEKPIKSFFDLLFVNQVREGNNAFFLPKDLKLPKATFTEINKFLVEGVIIGILAGALSVAIIGITYTYIANKMSGTDFMKLIGWQLISFKDMFNLILTVYLGLGIGIGIIGSSISMKKYLEV